MLPSTNLRFNRKVFVWLFLTTATAFAQLDPEGLVVYQQPSTSYTEAFEYRSFRQDNVLYATLVTFTGERKQLKAGGILAVLPYPPASFDDSFADSAQRAIQKIDSLEQTYPTIRQPLQQARAKWTRALTTFSQMHAKPATTAVRHDQPYVLSVGGGIFHNARITSATPVSVTIMHASGVTTLPIAQLNDAQLLELNRTSDKVQLPLGIMRPAGRVPAGSVPTESPLTLRVEAMGRSAVNLFAEKFGVSAATFSVWTFFVVLPGAVLLLLLGLIASARRSAGRVTRLPKSR